MFIAPNAYSAITREREGETHRQTDRQRQRDRNRETDRDRNLSLIHI